MQILEAAVIEFAKRYGIEKAIEYFGLDKQSANPKYAISLGNFTFDPVNAMKRSALSKGISSAIGGKLSGLSGILGPAALIGGAVMLGRAFDPMRPGSRNYNPNLAGQINYLNFNNMIGKDPSTGLAKYGPGSVLAGQNVMSMFGTNDYEKQLQNKIDYFEDRIKKGKPYSKKNYEKAKQEQAKIQDYNVQKTIEKNQFKNLQNINAGNDGAGMQTSGFSDVDGGPVSNRTGRGRQGYGKGGLASL